MNIRKTIGIKPLLKAGLLSLLLLLPGTLAYAAPEDLEETETSTSETTQPYPDSYYEPIQSNETPGWPQGPQIEAEAAIVMEANSRAILYEKNIDKELYPASITKIMTTLVAIEYGSLDDVVTFSHDAVYNIEEGSTHIGIQEGEKLTLRQCLYAIMLESANEVSNAVAEHIAGSIEEFAKLMNEKAAKLGCQHTNFTNPHGLQNENHYTSAYDMALISIAANHNPIFSEIANTKSYVIPITNMVSVTRPLANHHKMLMDGTEYSYDGCVGGKTGYTTSSLNTLVTITSKDNMELVTVILKENGAGKAYDETAALQDYALENFKNVQPSYEVLEYLPENYVDFLYPFIDLDLPNQKYILDFRYYYTAPKEIPDDTIEHMITTGSAVNQNDLSITYLYQGRYLGSNVLHDSSHSIFYYRPKPTPIKVDKNIDTITQQTDETQTRETETDEVLSSSVPFNSSHRWLSTFREKSSKAFHNITQSPLLITISILILLSLLFLIYTIIKLMDHHKIMTRKNKKAQNKEEK
ncbi:MAG TPA: D-alanyl-D-alanine carboxypeptidase [Candidatus Merdenecus merdavium]|nr:D-alanyl-D-alanine carboxypeptidase [Candidatus Merdenecus merdavium]